MKKLFWGFALLVASISFSQVFAQNQMTGLDHKDQYFIPEGVLCDDDSCCTQFEVENPLDAYGNLYEHKTFVGRYSIHSYTLHDAAQPYQITEPMTIIGVSYWSSETYFGDKNAYICIADDTLGILRRVKIPNYVDSATGDAIFDMYHHTEVFFDTAITLDSCLFYIVWDNPKAKPFDEDLYNWNSAVSSGRDEIYDTRLFYIKKCPEFTNAPLWRRCYVARQGVEYSDTTLISIDWAPTAITAAGWYMFPIIGELDTASNDTSSLAKVDIGNYTYVFPNPTSELVTVQCSFKIKTIEVYNSLGQKVEEFSVDGYIKSINTEKYPKDTYIFTIITDSGTTTQKVIVQ